MMELLDIPEEVIVGSICSRLTYNDVLRLRVVNKQLKGYADDHLKVRVTTQEFEINETDRTLDKFMNLECISTISTRIYFNVVNPQFFKNCQPEIEKFLEKYGDKISHVRVRCFHAFTVKGEMKFYGALSNLKHLELEEVDATKRICNKMKRGCRMENSPFPNNFKELETLKFGVVHWSKYPDMNYQWDMFNFCEKLVHFKHALYPHAFKDIWDEEPFGDIPYLIDQKRPQTPNGLVLKYYDVENLRDDNNVRYELIPLFRTFVERGVKLLNMDTCTMQMIFARCSENGLGDGEPILSLRHFNPGALCMQMPNLEEISIDGTCLPVTEVETQLNINPEWPKLKTLKISIGDTPFERSFMKQMINVLFKRVNPVREQLTELSLKLSDEVPINRIPYPKVDSIIATCPNLTKLTLVNYSHSAPNKAYSELWQGLPFLKEICLDKCISLGNAGFVGKNEEEPAFLQLKCLKKLTLKGLDKMTKITDTFFKLVLCRVKLSKFIVQSDAALVSISQVGISSLLNGQFGDSIEKFPFQGWSLQGLSEKEFQLLGAKFRSSHLI